MIRGGGAAASSAATTVGGPAEAAWPSAGGVARKVGDAAVLFVSTLLDPAYGEQVRRTGDVRGGGGGDGRRAGYGGLGAGVRLGEVRHVPVAPGG